MGFVDTGMKGGCGQQNVGVRIAKRGCADNHSLPNVDSS